MDKKYPILTAEQITKLINEADAETLLSLMKSYSQKKNGLITKKQTGKKPTPEMKLSFVEFAAIWLCSGKANQRGNRPGKPYVMCRKDDLGHYEMGNVRIDTQSANYREANEYRLTRLRESNIERKAKNEEKDRWKALGVCFKTWKQLCQAFGCSVRWKREHPEIIKISNDEYLEYLTLHPTYDPEAPIFKKEFVSAQYLEKMEVLIKGINQDVRNTTSKETVKKAHQAKRDTFLLTNGKETMKLKLGEIAPLGYYIKNPRAKVKLDSLNKIVLR